MFPTCPITASSDSSTVTVSSQQFGTIVAMAPGQFFAFVSSTACWIKQAADPTASAADGSMFVPAGVIVMIDGTNGVKLAVIRDAADGKASLTPVRV